MVVRLKDACERASKLPAAAQEQLAAQLLEDVEGESKWDETLAGSQDLLDRMAKQALDARRAGRTKAGGFDVDSRLTDEFLAAFAALPDRVKRLARKDRAGG